jgi:aldehyde:ferredoxin oxidoreductase
MWRGIGTPIMQATSSRGGGDHISDTNAWADSAVVCDFAALRVSSEEYNGFMVAFVKAATGWDFTKEEKNTQFNRIITLRRAYNVLEGIRRKDDTLPERFFTEPIPSGPEKGKVVDRKEFQHQIDLYYQDYGWNMEGVPTKETLMRLDMEDVYRKLQKYGVYNK